MKLAFILIFSTQCCKLTAQPGYAVNAITGDFAINKILNYPSPSASFGQFKNRLLVIDFFGTWCVPCIKALPKLTALQEKYKNEINILLVSEERQEKLESFIKKQTNFLFPVVVDEEKKFITLFQPPAYPYTVLVGKNNKVLAIPSQDDMTEENINKWLKEQQTNNGPVINQANETVTLVKEKNAVGVEPSLNKLVQLSQEFMYAAKTGDETLGFITQLQQLSMDELQSIIKWDDEKKAFWINLYNAFTQVILKNNPDQYKRRGHFFGSKQIEIAGNMFSLDDIEHGILRRSKIKWSLGHLNKLFPNRIEKQLRVDKLDYRLHFALNCGAKSCPPIDFYKPETIDQQLNLATKAYLGSEAEYNEASNNVTLPALMGWFRRDFGGKRKIIELLKQLSVVPAGKTPGIKFKPYDWTLYLHNYK